MIFLYHIIYTDFGHYIKKYIQFILGLFDCRLLFIICFYGKLLFMFCFIGLLFVLVYFLWFAFYDLLLYFALLVCFLLF